MDYSFLELKDYLISIDEKPFRAGQIYKSLHLGKSFSEMTDISIDLRNRLDQKFYSQSLEIIKDVKSVDGTQKFLFKLFDGNLIEGVLMHYKYGYTLCISTQVGCRMGCAFCASGLDGLIRNLYPAEMLGQIISVNKYLQDFNTVKIGGGLELHAVQGVGVQFVFHHFAPRIEIGL